MTNHLNLDYPSFTIILPTYQSAGYIKTTIDSLVPQLTSQDCLFVVDDQSTDSTVNIINDCAYDVNLIIENNPTSGPNSARNLAIKNAKTDYLLFLDSDDKFNPNSLFLLRSYLKNYSPDIAVYAFSFRQQNTDKIVRKSAHPFQFITSNSEIIKFAFKSSFYGSVCWNKAISRSLLQQNDILFISDRVHGRDSIFSKSISLVANSLLIIPEQIYTSYVRPGSFSRSFGPSNILSAMDNALHIDSMHAPSALKFFAIYNMFCYVLFLSYSRQSYQDFRKANFLLISWLKDHKYNPLSLYSLSPIFYWRCIFFISRRISFIPNRIIFTLLTTFSIIVDY